MSIFVGIRKCLPIIIFLAIIMTSGCLHKGAVSDINSGLPGQPYSETLILDNISPGFYENMSAMLAGDSVIESGEQVIIVNSLINLNNHSLIFREGSIGIIRNSVIANSSEEYRDGYVSRHPEEMEEIMQGEKGWGIKPSAGLAVETDNFVIDSSVIENSYGHGIYFYYAENPNVTNCRFINNAWSALRSEGSWGIYFANNTLEGNTWQNPGRVAFAQLDVDAGGNFTFLNNTISSKTVTEGAACFYGQKGMLIEGNDLDDSILLDKCHNCIITGNSAKEISLFGCGNITKYNNTGMILETEESGPEAWS
ncbi:MAG: right-handed parallel beta-helix repeat-containing protein [Candidatus Aenigmarchaeota archaeon]|nr:right-handed parallel beta-helix repeat-containing protein [Candidatus Aenigmarchaeota archaeon]